MVKDHFVLEALPIKRRLRLVLYAAELLYVVLHDNSKENQRLHRAAKGNRALTSEVFLSIQQFPRLSSEGLCGFH